MLKGKKILLGVTASIAAYKIPFLIRLLVKEGAQVQVLMTPAAKDFVTPLTLSTLSGRPVLSVPFNVVDGQWNSHVEMGNWADLMLIAPVSANTLAKMANGQADNLLLTTYLASKCPVFFAPAMDLDMYRHTSTQKNIQTLISYGNILIEPTTGELASGLCGAGRMEEPEEIVKILQSHLKKKARFEGKKFLISAGPTFEAIDPVRFIGNHSSGKMGFALALEAAERGAEVILVSGPSSIHTNHHLIHRVDVVSASDMHLQCTKFAPECNVIIMAAAIADYTPVEVSAKKIKKSDAPLNIQLKRTVDVLHELGENKPDGQILAGFALETDSEISNAEKKLKNKNLDFIVLNSLNDTGAGFGFDTNKICIIDKNGVRKDIKLKQKNEVASDIIDYIAKLLTSSL